eukprot:7193301-Prymnesium_polylepis.4
MPAEHHDPTGHAICPVRSLASPSTGVLMKPGSTSFGWSRPALSQYELAPPHFRGCASPAMLQCPRIVNSHCAAPGALYCPPGHGIHRGDPGPLDSAYEPARHLRHRRISSEGSLARGKRATEKHHRKCEGFVCACGRNTACFGLGPICAAYLKGEVEPGLHSLPRGQALHSATLLRPSSPEYEPSGQGVGTDDPDGQKWPAGQIVGVSVRSPQKEPSGHCQTARQHGVVSSSRWKRRERRG